MTENLINDLYLQPEEEIIKNAKDIAEASKSAEKYVFRIIYEASEKSLVLSEMKRMDCEILNQSDSKSCVIVKISMTQLAAIKTLNCIERVEVVDDEATAGNVEILVLKNTAKNDIMNVEAEATEQVLFSANGGVSTMSYSGSSYSNFDTPNTMQTAYYLPLSSWVNGCICCPGTEVWYRFTANVSNASEYIIYSSGSLDVVAYLYDSNGNYITKGDDEAGFPNFSITRQLTYGATYYVKVKAYGSNTGNYNIRVGYTTQSSSGGSSGNSNSDYSNDQSSAIQLTLNSWRSDEICCPGADMWYKFTPSTTAYYTIYSSGSLDTFGYLYDSNENYIDDDDDNGAGLNFKMVQPLTANQTYYIKVKACGINTGYFSVVVSDTVFVESVTINEEHVTLNKGETVPLSAAITPSYATNQTLRWESSDTSVVTVESLNSTTCKITAVNRGTACVCAFSQDGSNKSSCCEVIVNVPVESVVMDTTTRILHVGQGGRFKATALPENANNRNLRWTSSKQEVASVNSVTGYVTANAVGETNIIATAQDGSGKYGVCVLTVEPPIAVQGIDICCDTYTMNVGDTTYLSYDIYPSNAANQKVTWYSTNPSVASGDAITGEMTANSVGDTMIIVTTDDGSFADRCRLSVKEFVTIKKDGNYSNVMFNDGKVWKCNLYIYDNVLESNQPIDNQRAIHNDSIDFSEKQLGFLFRIDPNGVIYYVKNKMLGDNTSPTDYLIYRDNIFKNIYGRMPQYFIYENSQLYYCTGVNYNNRYSVYSEAELIFGILPRWSLQDVVEILLGAALSIISIYVPSLGVAMLTYDIVTAFFFTGAIEDATNSVANEFISDSIKTEYGVKMARRFGWAITVVNLIPSLLESALPPDIDNEQIAVYENAYQDKSYIIKISDDVQTVDLNDFIEHYKSLIAQ